MSHWRGQFSKWAACSSADHGAVRFQLQDPATVAVTLARIIAGCPERLVVVTADSRDAGRLTHALPTYQNILGDERPMVFVPELVMGRGDQWLPENEAARCAALDAALAARPVIFVMSVSAFLGPVMAPDTFAQRSFCLATGDSHMSPDALCARLIEMDYDSEFEVHVPGEFARRGGIVDLYSPLYEAPVRIEFFGDTIESMRSFLPETQRSTEQTQSLRVIPRGATPDEPERDAALCLGCYFGNDTPIAVCEPAHVHEHLVRFGAPEMTRQWDQSLSQAEQVFQLVTDIDETPGSAQRPATVRRADCVSLGDDLGPLLPELGEGAALWHWQQLRDHLLRWHGQGYALVACCGGEGEMQRFRELLAEDPKTAPLPVAVEAYRLDVGVLIPPARLVLLSERELFGRRPEVRRRRRRRYHFDHALREGFDLEEGSYAVHATQGICIYRGIRQVEVTGELQEVMEFEFDDEARLYVPLDQAHLVSRYVGGRKKVPRVSRLGSPSWRLARESATAAAWDLAADLLRVAAVRKQAEGFASEPVPDWEQAFAIAFPYEETEDQTEAINAVLHDMAGREPMDHLLCGDVGYGKTEVAMRAAFRAVLNDKQVAVLVPTTVLAQQHFITFRERMAEYPIEIEMISRFRTAAEQKRILERLALGRIDIVIGTHRLLQGDVTFNDLGLVVIDEEQRFGVAHKQKFKQLRASVDVLTMTATPIPRTLYLSLSGIRRLSTIMSAPAERLPITTVVAQYDGVLIRQSILRELERQGQVYYLHNRVQSIERVAAYLQDLVPEARFGVAHGQMPSTALETVMVSFIAGDIDVLVCTTIIESGLDIPNANTIVIDRADRFGLAELYQLRGRVGRYHNQAFAYLLLPPMGALPENARQRLAAIRRYTHLGAGFKLALRDLEIRGAGNILGREQSGHIAAVGFELYCKLLREAVGRLEKALPRLRERVPVVLDGLVFGIAAGPGKSLAAIPPAYIGTETGRIECYRRVNRLTIAAEVDSFAAELADRFGPPPEAVQNLLQVARVRSAAAAAGIVAVTVRGRQAILETERGLVKGPDRRLPRLRCASAEGQLQELLELLGRLTDRTAEGGSGA